MPAVLSIAYPALVPTASSPDMAVAPNFERFDGLTPLDNAPENPEFYVGGPRPGVAAPTPIVYTRGPIAGLVNTLGGQPLPVSPRVYKNPGDYTHSRGVGTLQFRLGVGQNYGGIQQTVALSEISQNPPQPGDLTSIIAGLG
jgi:hypothetical protein